MSTFIDPRTHPTPDANTRPARTTANPNELADLHRLCREGSLYEVERWIQAGRPLQLAEAKTTHRRRRFKSALETALDQGNHALALLLLCNGYDPNCEAESPLNLVLRSRRFDLVDLLLEWGADPHDVDPGDLFDTYNSKLFERFRRLGVDLTADHALALTLAYHTSNKPLFGFARRHRKDDPKYQSELNIALAHDASEGNEKGVALSLWAGADPHAPALCLRYWSATDEEDDEEEDAFDRYSAVYEVCSRGDVKMVERLGPDPALDDFDRLYRVAGSGEVLRIELARIAAKDGVGAADQLRLALHAHTERAAVRRVLRRPRADLTGPLQACRVPVLLRVRLYPHENLRFSRWDQRTATSRPREEYPDSPA